MNREVYNIDFYYDDTLESNEIAVHVDGIGYLNFPLQNEIIEQLIGTATKSHFTLDGKRVFDEGVRNSYEIPKEKMQVNIDNESLTDLLLKMNVFLGLTPDATLTAKLQNMLIYGKGSFFKLHRDTERIPNTVGTLVLVLPSPHIGGDLAVHFNKEHVFSSENIYGTEVKYIGFQSDCFHEVKEVRDGFRVALTYKLVLESPTIETVQRVNNMKTRIHMDRIHLKSGFLFPILRGD